MNEGDYTFPEMRDMHFVYGLADGNAAEARRLYAERYPNRVLPVARVFTNIHRRLGEMGQLGRYAADAGRGRNVRNPELEEAVLQHFADQPSTSTRAVGNQLGVSHSSVWRVLHENGQHPFSRLPVHELTPVDYPLRVDFAETVLVRCEVEPDFPAIIMFTDESCFKRESSYNTRNYHLWSEENPHGSYVRGFQHRLSVNLWVGILGDHLIGPHRLPARLNGDTYLAFLQDILPGLMEDIPLALRQRMWFQQDGAPPHFDLRVREYLLNVFQGRVIMRGAPAAAMAIPWPARSPDVTPPDFFVWGFYKNEVYDPARGPIVDEEDLLQRIEEATNALRALAASGRFARVREDFVRRLRKCIEVGGRQFEHLL